MLGRSIGWEGTRALREWEPGRWMMVYAWAATDGRVPCSRPRSGFQCSRVGDTAIVPFVGPRLGFQAVHSQAATAVKSRKSNGAS